MGIMERLIYLESKVIKLEEELEDLKMATPFASSSGTIDEIKQKAAALGIGIGEYLREKSRKEAPIHRERARKKSVREYKRIKAIGDYATGYVYKKRTFREGYLHGGRFYFIWGNGAKSVPIDDGTMYSA